jgi:Family of unknown function (DUF6318)
MSPVGFDYDAMSGIMGYGREPMFGVQRYAALLLAALCVTGLAACTASHQASATSTDNSADPTASLASPTATSPTVSPTSSASVPVAPTPSAPTIPADVPRTGNNLTKAHETPPVMPVLATLDSAPGALAFAKFFIQTIDWAYATGSTTYMRHYFTAACTNCTVVAHNLDEARQKKVRFVGNRFLDVTASSISRSDAPTNGGQNADFGASVKLNITGFAALNTAGKTVQAAPPTPGFHYQVYLLRSGANWQVVNFAGDVE